MKGLKSSLGAKISACILFVISLVAVTVCGIGILYLAYGNVYFDEGKTERENIVDTYLYDQMHDISMYYENEINEDFNKKNYDNGSYKFDSLLNIYGRDDTNLAFTIIDAEGNEIVSNCKIANPKYEKTEVYTIIKNKKYENEIRSFETYNERWAYIEECEDKYYDVYYDYYDQNTDSDETYECILDISYMTGEPVDITVVGCVNDKLSVKDDLFFRLAWFDKLVELRYTVILLAAMALIICLVSFVFLLCAAGHKDGEEGIHLNWADKIPLDLYWGALAFIAIMLVLILDSGIGWSYGWHSIVGIICAGVVIFAVIMLGMAAVLSFASRAKYGKWWKNTVIYMILNLIRKCIIMLFKAIPAMPKLMIGLALLCVVNFIIAVLDTYDGSILFWFAECVLLVPFVVMIAFQLRKLKKGIDNIACGDFKSQVDTAKLLPELKACGESINDINNVLSREVNERMKSERFKTELITNVSHDIKTPLTSIISYVDIIKKKEIADEELKAYIEVLDRQSGRLKKLIEDLVECSKAQTGNITVNKTSLDIGVLLTQTVGEYQEKLEANALSLVVEQPNESLYVSADGRLLWRAVDNLLNNACKYSLPGTRVYLKLEKAGKEAVVTLKNVSKDQLNMSSDELMERFVRGDSSRNTEGSGLGLAIAKSLLDLQQAKLELKIDGDLFKVVIKYRLIEGEFVNAGNQKSDEEI